MVDPVEPPHHSCWTSCDNKHTLHPSQRVCFHYAERAKSVLSSSEAPARLPITSSMSCVAFSMDSAVPVMVTFLSFAGDNKTDGNLEDHSLDHASETKSAILAGRCIAIAIIPGHLYFGAAFAGHGLDVLTTSANDHA